MTERTYTIPLRRGWQKVPRWRRAKRAVSEIQTYLKKHTKSKEVRIDKWINELVWGKGAKNPPSKITIKVSFDKDKAITELTELPGKAKRLKEAKKSLVDKSKKKCLLKLVKDEKTKKVDEHRKKKEQEKAVLEEVDNKTPTKKQEMAANKQ